MPRSPLLAVPVLVLALAGCGSSSSSSSSAASGSSSAAAGSSGSSSAAAGSSGSSSAAAGSSGSTSAAAGSSGATSAGAAVTVNMTGLKFDPATIHVKVGQTVQWVNKDTPPHNVTYQTGPKFTSSAPILNPGATYSYKFTQAGTITYYCSIHPFMKGTIVVAP